MANYDGIKFGPLYQPIPTYSAVNGTQVAQGAPAFIPQQDYAITSYCFTYGGGGGGGGPGGGDGGTIGYATTG